MKVVRKMFWILEARSPPKRSGKCDLVKMCASWSSKKSSGGGDYTTRRLEVMSNEVTINLNMPCLFIEDLYAMWIDHHIRVLC